MRYGWLLVLPGLSCRTVVVQELHKLDFQTGRAAPPSDNACALYNPGISAYIIQKMQERLQAKLLEYLD